VCKRFKLTVGHLGFVHPKAVDADGVRGAFMLVRSGVVRTHGELPAGNPHHSLWCFAGWGLRGLMVGCDIWILFSVRASNNDCSDYYEYQDLVHRVMSSFAGNLFSHFLKQFPHEI